MTIENTLFLSVVRKSSGAWRTPGQPRVSVFC